MNANNLFRLYAFFMGIVGIAVEYQREPDKPFIAAFGLGVIVAMLLPGIVVSLIAVGHFAMGIVVPASLVFWLAVCSISKSAKKKPVHFSPTPPSITGCVYKKRTRVVSEER